MDPNHFRHGLKEVPPVNDHAGLATTATGELVRDDRLLLTPGGLMAAAAGLTLLSPLTGLCVGWAVRIFRWAAGW